MPQVFLGLGSNIERYTHITAALDKLSEHFGDLLVSSVYESEAVGFLGEPFLNLVVALDTALSLASLNHCLRQIEYANGRRHNAEKFSSRTLDIDILTYGDLVGIEAGIRLPRDEITKNAYVLLPLAEMAGAVLHPELGVSYRQLWSDYDKSKQKVWPIRFTWHDKELTQAALLE